MDNLCVTIISGDLMKNERLEMIKTCSITDFIKNNEFLELLNSLTNESKCDCYFDCDGVLLDTITTSFKDMKLEIGKEYRTPDIVKYYQNIDWVDLINRSGEINHSSEKLLILKELNIFKNIGIATHRNTYMNEGMAKKNYFNKHANGITVFDIPIKLEKHFALKATNNILVDDSKKKILGWIENGGIGVLFDQNVSELLLPDENRPYYVTNNLLDLIKIVYIKNLILEKSYQKTR